ncbi:sporulation integral membrane protein YtvI [Fervidicella metallireducens]|uniref:sporulation integral membrane protein YtvI n=1 Tax=Fervidicella metallireducens TaxID=655338 RepID=UPI0005598045|nr:sporulation integral membrane protein YtvI [Fervidicella metallireducens]
MFDEKFIRKLDKFSIFLLIYTLIFIVFFSTLPYTLPFVAALIIAAITKPFTRFLKNKLKISVSIASLISTLTVFIFLLLIVTTIVFKITYEARQLLMSVPDVNTLKPIIIKYFDQVMVYFNQIDPSIVTKIQAQVLSVLSTTFNVTVIVLNKLVSIAISLPVVLMIVFITLLATYFFSRDMTDMKDKFMGIFSPYSRGKFHEIWDETIKMIFNYLKAYSLIIFITFLETFIGFSILKIKYTFMLSLLSAFLDILPILGIGSLYIPLIIYNIIIKNYFTAIGLGVLYILITVIRQIIEPKLVSSSLDLHPVAVLAAIFIGLKAYGFLGMFYLILLMILYKVLVKIKII